MIVALVALAFGANAQSVNVQSAISDLRKNYLDRAKSEIDLATVHENTKDDPKTWCYRGMIYSQIGGAILDPKTKAKIRTTYEKIAPDWLEQSYAAAIECKRLDTKNEYADLNNKVIRYVGEIYYNRSLDAYNAREYANALDCANKAIEMYKSSGDNRQANEATFVAGISAQANSDTEGMKNYFTRLVRSRTNKAVVYKTLFSQYKKEENKDKAMSVANSYMKNCKSDPQAYVLMADAYIMNDNRDKAVEVVNNMLAATKDSANYPVMLGAAAQILEEVKDYEGAENRYKESLQLVPVQFEANFGMGKMIFNRAVDKLDAANAVPPDDETGLYDKLLEESKGFFRNSVSYFQAAVKFIDDMPEGDAKTAQRVNLFNCLTALNTVYARLEMYDEAKAVKARLNAIQAEQ